MGNLIQKLSLLGLLLATATACTPQEFHQIASQSPTKTDTPDTPVSPTPAPQPPTPPGFKVDSFTQDESANKVDILVIDDNSYSMEVEQKKMAERFPSFISSLADLDYQIAVTTTDIDSANPKLNMGGRALAWTGTNSILLTSKTPGASSVFKNTIKRSETIGCAARGDCPSGNEQPLKATILAMQQRFSANTGVFRDNVDLAVVVLSDEDELSNGPANATTAQDVLSAFQSEFNGSKRLRFYGLVVQSGDTDCLKMQRAQTGQDDSSFYGTRVEALAKATGGTTGSICADDFSKSLTDISKSVRKLIGTFELSSVPTAGVAKVTLTPAPAKAIGYHVEGKNLIFDTPPAAGTRIDVTYAR